MKSSPNRMGISTSGWNKGNEFILYASLIFTLTVNGHYEPINKVSSKGKASIVLVVNLPTCLCMPGKAKLSAVLSVTPALL